MIKLKLILFLILTSCISTQQSSDVDEDDYLFVIHFAGNDIENQNIDLVINNEALFQNVKFTEIPINIYVYDMAIGYYGNTIELFSLRNESVPLQRKKLKINDLNVIKLSVEINGKHYDEIINIANGNVQIVKIDDGKIEVFKAPWL